MKTNSLQPALITENISLTDKVDAQSNAVSCMSEQWPIVTALLGGTSAMRKAGKKYLPRSPSESEDAYNDRLQSSTLYPAFKRTIEILASKPFSKASTTSDDTPAQIKEWLKNADRQGRDIQAFSSVLFQQCMSYGLCGVLVDYPPENKAIRTKADERIAGVRPYFVHYSPWNILGWRTSIIDGAERLVQLRLQETIVEPRGKFSDEEIKQIRVLEPGAWQTYRQNEKKDWVLHEEGFTTLDEIPFVPFYGNRKGFFTAEPPLIELAYQNVEHYQSSSDQRNIVHVARVPILTLIGAQDGTQLTISSNAAVNLPMGAMMQFVEHSGASIGAGRESILDLEARMRETGAELLVLQPGKITATQVASENEGNKCALQRMTENFEDSMNQCLKFMAAWVKESSGGTFSLYKDFGAANLTDASAQLLAQMASQRQISVQTLIAELKRRGVLSPDLDYEEEQERIESQGPLLGEINESEAAA